MKFTTSAKNFLDAISICKIVVPSSPILPILEYIKIKVEGNKLYATASDLNTTVSLTYDLGMESVEDGEICLPYKLFSDTLKLLKDSSFTLNADSVDFTAVITAKKAKYKLVGETPLDFPTVSSIKESADLVLSYENLVLAANRTTFCLSSDDLRPAMQGYFFSKENDKLIIVTTDGYKLAVTKHAFVSAKEENFTFLTNKKFVSIVTDIAKRNKQDVVITLSENHVYAQSEDYTIISRLIDERFPDYKAVLGMDRAKNESVINTKEFLESISSALLYSNKITNLIKLSFNDNILDITGEDLDYSTESKDTVDIDYNGEKMDIGFNGKWLSEVVSHIETDKLKIKMESPNRAAYIYPHGNTEGDNKDFFFLLTPVMLNNSY